MVKCLWLTLIFFLTATLSTFPQSSSSAATQDPEFGMEMERQTAITFKVFEREFILTNSAEDYHRSFQRLIANYGIKISDYKLSEILAQLSREEKAYVVETVSSLVLEAKDFSIYTDNHYYTALNAAALKITKLNIAAALEVALVDEYRKVAAVRTAFSSNQSANIRFLHLINHARYEILNALLHRSSKR